MLPRQSKRVLKPTLVAMLPLLLIMLALSPSWAADDTVSTPVAGTVRTIDLGNGVTMELVWVPGGTFTMGSPRSQHGHFHDEEPMSDVSVDGFWFGKYEVTQAQYRAIVGANPSHFQGDNNPVDQVSWNDSIEFCKKLSEKTGQSCTLPTEAQWEYACRAATTTAFNFGDHPSWVGNYAWWGNNSRNTTHPVGLKLPSKWGLYDIGGNVWEWTLSLYKPYPYSDTDGRNDLTDTTGHRVIRGGSWRSDNQVDMRSSRRVSYYPTRREKMVGFRCIMAP